MQDVAAMQNVNSLYTGGCVSWLSPIDQSEIGGVSLIDQSETGGGAIVFPTGSDLDQLGTVSDDTFSFNPIGINFLFLASFLGSDLGAHAIEGGGS